MTELREPSVILLDIDGTVVNYNLQIPQSDSDAISQARANGHRIYLCTGRAKAEIYEFLWDLGIDGLILGNGAYVEDEGEVIHRQVMDPEVVERAIEWLDAQGLGYYLECNSGLFATDNLTDMAVLAVGDDNPNMRAVWEEAMAAAVYDTGRGHDDVNKISFALSHPVDLDILGREFEGDARISTWTASGKKQEFGEFGQIGIHKAVGVDALAQHRGVSREQMIAFGDAEPDLELIEYVGTGVAMGNGAQVLKERADLVADHIDEGGLAKAFHTLGLIG